MATFLKNLQALETEFASGMELEAGKGIKVRTIFNALKKLEKGEYSTIGEMCKKMGFNPQNVTFQALSTMLKEMGTDPVDLSTGKGKTKLDGNQFALAMLQKKGLKIETKKRS